jgi:hypothetical protein
LPSLTFDHAFDQSRMELDLVAESSNFLLFFLKLVLFGDGLHIYLFVSPLAQSIYVFNKLLSLLAAHLLGSVLLVQDLQLELVKFGLARLHVLLALSDLLPTLSKIFDSSFDHVRLNLHNHCF